jgi:ATP-dependent DNA ligase
LIEIKHDGFRIIVRKSGGQLRLYSRPGLTSRVAFPLIAGTLARLRSRSCIIITRMVVQKMQVVVQKNAS